MSKLIINCSYNFSYKCTKNKVPFTEPYFRNLTLFGILLKDITKLQLSHLPNYILFDS